MAHRYVLLGDYLAQQAARGQRRVVLPFAHIEGAILGQPLPAVARAGRSWWQNVTRYDYAWFGWLRSGWFVADVSAATETVTFVRRDDDA